MLKKVFPVLALAVWCSCGSERGDSPDTPSRTALPQAQRVVSLTPSISELMFDLGAGDLLVGRTRWGSYPAALAEVPSVGDGLNPNVEAVVARNPDLVVMYPSPANALARARFRELGIETLTLRTDLLSDITRAARTLGERTGTAARAESLAVRLERQLDSLARWNRSLGVTLVILAWHDPPIVIGRTSFQHQLVELAGAANAFRDLEAPSGQVSIETLAERDPDLILRFSDEEDMAFLERPEWRALTAVRERKVVRLSGTEYSQPSLRAAQAVRNLRAALEEAIR